MNGTKYISEIITASEIAIWGNNNVMLVAPPGAGKSHFIKNNLFDYAKANNKQILLLLPRLDTVLQFKSEIESAGKNDTITVKSYQEIEQRELKAIKSNLSKYDYIVMDECHYFISDSKFNFCTDISLNVIMQTENVVRIFMTATPDKIRRYLLEEMEIELKAINEQILKFAQNYPTISKTASSDAPFLMKE